MKTEFPEEQKPLITKQPLASDNTNCCFVRLPKQAIENLLAKCPAGMSKETWKKQILRFSNVTIAPMAGMSGFQGGLQVAEKIPSGNKCTAFTCALLSWLGITVSFLKGFYDCLRPDADNPDPINSAQEQAKCHTEMIMSSLFAACGAAPSFALLLSSCEKMRAYPFSCLQGLSFRWIDYLFASSSAIANCSLGTSEGSQWFTNAKTFFAKLQSEQTGYKDATLLIVCAFIVAYLAITSLIGYVPPLVNLIERCLPKMPYCVTYTCSIFTVSAEWMFMTNMMFSQDKNPQCCYSHFSNPLPPESKQHCAASTVAVVLALASGFSMASFTYEALAPVDKALGLCLTSTAWTGGFWTTAQPAYQHCSKPLIARGKDLWSGLKSYICS